MRQYLDEDLAALSLVQLLRRAGHEVHGPGDPALRDRSDVVQLTQAIRDSRVIVTRNYEDFTELHDLVLLVQGHQPGILVSRRDKDSRRNLRPHDIVRAIRSLETAGVPIADQYNILNA